MGFAGSCCGYAFGASVMFAECSLCQDRLVLLIREIDVDIVRADLTILTPPNEVGLASAARLLVLVLEGCQTSPDEIS